MRTFDGYTKGINLGGWFSQCNHTEERYNTFIQENDIAALAGWGIDHVRLPVDYNLLETERGEYKESGFARLEKAILWCKQYGLKLVLDLHKTAGFSFDAGEREAGFFSSPALQERFYRLWEELTRRYARYADFVAFELLNEVTDKSLSASWNAIATTCIQRIRAVSTDSRRVWILVGGYWNNSIDALADLAVPLDERIVYNFHCYEPLLFTHQGAYWVQGMPQDFRMKFPAPVQEYKEKAQALGQYSSPILDSLSGGIVNGEVFDILFAKAVSIAKERNVPLYCGEYGVINLASQEDTTEWYRLINKAFTKYGISRAAWSYKQMDFGISDTETLLERIKPLL